MNTSTAIVLIAIVGVTGLVMYRQAQARAVPQAAPKPATNVWDAVTGVLTTGIVAWGDYAKATQKATASAPAPAQSEGLTLQTTWF